MKPKQWMLIFGLGVCAGLPVFEVYASPTGYMVVKDTHRLRELRLKEAIKNGDLTQDELNEFGSHRRFILRELEEKRLRSAGDNDAPRRFWRDKRKEQLKTLNSNDNDTDNGDDD